MQISFNKFGVSSFKARFSNDDATISILKRSAAVDPQNTKMMVDLLKTAEVGDVVSLSTHKKSDSYFFRAEDRNSSGKLISVTDGHNRALFRMILNVKLSNGKKVSSYLPMLSGMPLKTNREVMEHVLKNRFDDEANLSLYNKQISEKIKKIREIEKEITDFRENKAYASKCFVMNYIDENV